MSSVIRAHFGSWLGFGVWVLAALNVFALGMLLVLMSSVGVFG